jgi:hypothetical protein
MVVPLSAVRAVRQSGTTKDHLFDLDLLVLVEEVQPSPRKSHLPLPKIRLHGYHEQRIVLEMEKIERLVRIAAATATSPQDPEHTVNVVDDSNVCFAERDTQGRPRLHSRMAIHALFRGHGFEQK